MHRHWQGKPYERETARQGLKVQIPLRFAEGAKHEADGVLYITVLRRRDVYHTHF